MRTMTLAERLEADDRDELTQDEARAFAAEQTEKYLGMTPEEFADAAANDTLPDTPVVLHLALLLGVELTRC